MLIDLVCSYFIANLVLIYNHDVVSHIIYTQYPFSLVSFISFSENFANKDSGSS